MVSQQDLGVTILSHGTQWNSSLRQYSVKQLVCFIGGEQGYMCMLHFFLDIFHILLAVFFKNPHSKPGTVEHSFNPGFQGHPGIHRNHLKLRV